MGLRRKPTLVKTIPRLQMCGNYLVRDWKTIGRTRRQTKRLVGPTHHAGLATIPSSFLRNGSALRLGPLCLWDHDQNIGETICCIVEVTPKDILDPHAHFFCEDGMSCCRTCCPPLRYALMWAFQNLRNIHETETITGTKNLSSQLGHACIRYSSLLRFRCLGLGHTLIFGLRRYVSPARSCGANVEDCQSVFSTFVAYASQLVPRHPHRLQNTSVSRNRVEYSDVSLALQCPRTFLLPFHCLSRPSEARRFPWCHVETLDGSLSTHHEEACGIVNIRNPETHRIAGRAAQQHVSLHCPENSQLVNTMLSSFPDHGLDAAIWTFIAAQHCAYVRRQLRNFGVSLQLYTLHGQRGGRTTDRWLQYRDLPSALHKVADRLCALAEFAPQFSAKQLQKESRHHPLQPPR